MYDTRILTVSFIYFMIYIHDSSWMYLSLIAVKITYMKIYAQIGEFTIAHISLAAMM